MSSGQSVGGDSGDAMSRAVDAYDQGELDASRVLCEQQLRVEPANAVALMLLGLIAKRGLQVEDAIPLLERSVRIAPNRKSLTSLADCYLRVGRLKQGLHYIDQVLAGNTDNLEALLIKAAILHGQQKFDDALACIDDAARLAPESHLVEARLGSVLAELGQYEAAEQHFQTAARVSREARHCGLINFRQSVWREIAPSSAVAVADEFAHLRAPDIEAPYDAVVAACCDARYFYKYGVTFMNSYAQNAAGGKLLHLHILDPEEDFAAHLETLIAQLGLRNVVATYEYAPVDEEPDFNLRRTFYSCARFLRMAALLAHYQKTIACFDIDTVFEAPLDELVGSVGGADIGLVRRDPPDSPWLDIVANIVIANNTAGTLRYFSAVENFIRHFVGRGKLFWHLDQIALFCVLKMMERFDAPPQVAPIPPSALGAVWHIGNPYEYRRAEYRVARYQLADFAPQAKQS